MKRFILLIFALLFFSGSLLAQPMVGPGCKVGNRIYQVNIGTYFFWPLYQGYGGAQYSEWTTEYDITYYPCYSWTNQGSTCIVRMSTGLFPNNVAGNGGYFTLSTTGSCAIPIDDHIWVLLIPAAAFGVHKINKGKRFPS